MPPKATALVPSESCDCCEGHGYAVFRVDRDPGVEIQRCDNCRRLKDDNHAAARLVQDLVRRVPWAVNALAELTADVEAQNT